MSCSEYMIRDVHVLTPEMTVEDALKTLIEKGVRSMPVIDTEGKLIGMFNFRSTLRHLLPGSVVNEKAFTSLAFMDDDINYVLKKYESALEKTVEDLMLKEEIPMLKPDSVFEDALIKLYRNDISIPVVDPETGKLVGIFTKQCGMQALRHRHEERLREEGTQK